MFRLLSLTILGHRVLGNVSLNFRQEDGNNQSVNDIYTSVIIGENGIGKSYLMRVVADIFSYLDGLIDNKDYKKSPVDYKFSIKYRVGIADYEFTNINQFEVAGSSRRLFTHTRFKCNGEEVRVGEMDRPSRIIASTMTVTDKFTTVNSGRYIYKGIRNEKSPGTTGTRTMIRKTVSGLLHSLDAKEGFRQELIDLLDHMGLQSRLEICYSFHYRKHFLKPDITRDRLCEIFDHQDKYFENRKFQLWGTANFQKIRTDEVLLDRVALFLSNVAVRYGNEKRIELNYSVLEEANRINEDKDVLEALSAIDLLSFPVLKVFKGGQNYNFDESSSGETHLLCQLIGIMSDIEHGSLVLIDEPENSCHPNWQINYIGWLKDIFRHYCDCHFIIATHSHFMLSDLAPGSSDIIALEKKDGHLNDIADGYSTYCWSTDDILYRVFHVRNTRNYVFEGKLVELYKMVSNREDKKQVALLIEELSQYRLNGDDPLVKLLETARNYVKSV